MLSEIQPDALCATAEPIHCIGDALSRAFNKITRAPDFSIPWGMAWNPYRDRPNEEVCSLYGCRPYRVFASGGENEGGLRQRPSRLPAGFYHTKGEGMSWAHLWLETGVHLLFASLNDERQRFRKTDDAGRPSMG